MLSYALVIQLHQDVNIPMHENKLVLNQSRWEECALIGSNNSTLDFLHLYHHNFGYDIEKKIA